MNRSLSIALWLLLGACLLIPIVYVGMIGVLLLRIAGPDPDAVLAKAQPVVHRIAVALEEHHRRHGRYPRELSDLVKQGLLVGLPDLPPHWGTSSKYGPTYEANSTLDFFRLSFGYHVLGGIGPGDTHWRVFVSDDPKGWATTGSPGSMEDLVAERVLAIYRAKHDGKSLDLFMNDVIGKADCDYLYRSRVVRWLGEGTEMDLPPDIFGTGKKGYVYQAQDDLRKRYCFVYKDHWLPLPVSMLPDGERAKHPERHGDYGSLSVDKNYPVLDELFVNREGESLTTRTIVRDCPDSPRDKPSGRHEIVP